MLGVAGLLYGSTATTHWSGCSIASPPSVPHRPTSVVVEHLDQRIDHCRWRVGGDRHGVCLVEILFDRTAAEASQLMIEYDPQPPYDAGATHKAGDEAMTRVIEYVALRS